MLHLRYTILKEFPLAVQCSGAFRIPRHFSILESRCVYFERVGENGCCYARVFDTTLAVIARSPSLQASI